MSSILMICFILLLTNAVLLSIHVFHTTNILHIIRWALNNHTQLYTYTRARQSTPKTPLNHSQYTIVFECVEKHISLRASINSIHYLNFHSMSFQRFAQSVAWPANEMPQKPNRQSFGQIPQHKHTHQKTQNKYFQSLCRARARIMPEAQCDIFVN